MLHNNAQDFFFYQTLMNRGGNGDLLTTDAYTGEAHKPSIIFAYFVWLGKLSKLFGIPFSYMYHVLRITFGILLFAAAYYLILSLKIPFPRLTFLFFIFAAPLMHQISDGSKIISVPYMNWWTGMDPIRRAAYLPHHMMGGFLLVATLFLLLRYFRKAEMSYLIVSLILAVLMSFIHTPSLFIILMVLPTSIVLYTALKLIPYITKNQNKLADPVTVFLKLFKPELRQFAGMAAYWIISMLLLLYMVKQTNQGFPWSQYIDWERRLQFPLDNELTGALGILLPFSAAGIIVALISRKFENLLLVCWLVIPFLFIPFAYLFGISNIRLIQGVPYLPLSILAILGIQMVIQFFSYLLKMKLKVKNEKLKIRIISFLPKIILSLVLLLFAVFTYPELDWSLKDQIREFWPIFGNVYLDNRLYDAFSFINNMFPNNTLTLSTFYTGNYLPAFTTTTSYIGHSGYTYRIDSKQPDVFRFFRNEMTETEAKDYIIKNKIKLVWQGPEEKPLYPNKLYPGVLKIIYDREEVTLYVLK